MRISIKKLIDNIKIRKPSRYGEAAYSESPNAAGDLALLNWINEVEGRVISDVIKMYEKQTITVTKDVLEYDLLEEYNSMDVVDVFVDKVPKSKSDLRDLYNAYITDNTVFNSAISNDSKLIFQTGKDCEVTIIYQKKFTPFDENDLTYGQTGALYYLKENNIYLLVEYPYCKIYWEYVEAKIDYYNKEYKAYNNGTDVYNHSFEEFAKWYKNRNPIDTNAKVRNLW